MNERLADLLQCLGYAFQQQDLLDQALHHRSAGGLNNERLEFLGDSILGFVISVELYRRYPEAKEGELSRLRSLLVNREVLAALAIELQLNHFIHLGVGERKSGGAKRQSILADAVEAIIGAIYLDGGMNAASSCIIRWLSTRVDELSHLSVIKDPKSTLQEWVQAHKLPLPQYEVETSGKAHAQTFRIFCTVEGLPYQSEGVSTSRRKAEQIAAENFLELLNDR